MDSIRGKLCICKSVFLVFYFMNTAVSYSTKSFILPFGIVLIIMVQVSMGLMLIPIFLGLHILFAMGTLIGSMYLIIALISGVTVYTINEEGISVQIRPMLPWKWWRYEKKKFYPWSSVSSYSIGEDMTRGMEKFHYIKIEIRGLANDLKISDNAKFFAGFEEFKQAFIERVNERNAHLSKPKTASTTTGTSVSAAIPAHSYQSKEKPIKRKPSFYESWLAKIVTILFVIFIAGLFTFFIYHPEHLKWTHLVKISILIIPGLGYMFYRSFLEKK